MELINKPILRGQKKGGPVAVELRNQNFESTTSLGSTRQDVATRPLANSLQHVR